MKRCLVARWVRWPVFGILSLATWAHSGFMSLRLYGIWWGAQKDFCPKNSTSVLMLMYFVPFAVAGVLELCRRSQMLLMIPFHEWFECWTATLLAMAVVFTIAPLSSNLIPLCVN